MVQPAQQACALPDVFRSSDLQQQAELLRGCHEADVALLLETEQRRRALTNHIQECER